MPTGVYQRQTLEQRFWPKVKANLYITPSGTRNCKTCAHGRYMARKRAA